MEWLVLYVVGNAMIAEGMGIRDRSLTKLAERALDVKKKKQMLLNEVKFIDRGVNVVEVSNKGAQSVFCVAPDHKRCCR